MRGFFFSIPASGLLLDKRLFTDSDSHPINSPVRLYINKDAGVTVSIEPDDDGAIYIDGTPHYVDYIQDLRDMITDVTELHAGDSDHVAQQFLTDHLIRTRAPYDLSSHDIRDGEYVHPSPSNTIPSGAAPPGSSGSIPSPGDGYELGAQQITDIDVDEVQWQGITRPKNLKLGTPANIPIEPIFPAVLSDGTFPAISSLDEVNLTQLALNSSVSGGILLTGDMLVDGTSLKILSASGSIPDDTTGFITDIPWKLFPCERELCTYYTPNDPTATLTARGRQAIYGESVNISDGVYMLAISNTADVSGSVVQHYPANYHALSGVDANGHAHDGLHITNKLIYDLSTSASDGTVIGYSPINGKKVFAHWSGSDTGSKGETFNSSSVKYPNGNSIFIKGEVTNFFTTSSLINWAITNNTISPISWSNISTTALGPRFSPFTGAGVTYKIRDMNASSNNGVMTIKEYALWGFIDQVVFPDSDRGTGGQSITETIISNTIVYREGQDENGEFEWQQESEFSTTRDLTYLENTYSVNNIFSFFFYKKPNNGLVHVNGETYFQWSNSSGGTPVKPQLNKFAPFGDTTSQKVPATTRGDTIVSIGFFPSWKRLRYVTTNNQVVIPQSISISPASSKTISFDPDLDFDESTIEAFSAPVWDPENGVNYIYFTMKTGGSQKIFFAHMDTDFIIFRFNQTDGDGFSAGRAALLSI
jgi:hypothetical protein